MANKLTLKQQKFIDYYIELGNATQAAIQAGYKKDNAKQQGSENLAKLDSHIKEKMNSKANDRIASQDEVLEYLTRVMRGEELDQFGLDAALQDRTKCAELLQKRYDGFSGKKVDDINEQLALAKLKRAEAEATIIEFEAEKLKNGGKGNPLLDALMDVVHGGDGSGD